jgi:hypothetical protein
MVADGTDASRTWRRWADVAELFDGPSDPEWTADRDRVDHEVRDPWGNGYERRGNQTTT